MEKLYSLLKNYTLQDVLSIEKQDLQYKSLEKLYNNIIDETQFLSLILANSIVCYQLSSTGERYWEEFAYYFSSVIPAKVTHRQYTCGTGIYKINIIKLMIDFLPNSKGNKRFVDIKIKRLNKLEGFLINFEKNIDFYTKDLVKLRDELAYTMNQQKDAKTIVFAIKMIMYGIMIMNENSVIASYGEAIQKRGRLVNVLLCSSQGQYSDFLNQDLSSIEIPIDSRLTQIFEKYKEDYTDIKLFYSDLSKKLQIPEIHLDAIIWVNFEELMK